MVERRILTDSAMNVPSTELQLDDDLHQTERSVFSQNRVTRIVPVFVARSNLRPSEDRLEQQD